MVTKCNGQVAHTTWICKIKDWFMSWMRWRGMLQVLITLLRMVCDSVSKTYELLISGIFYLISSDHSWPWVTETSKSKTTDNGETTCSHWFLSVLTSLLLAVCFASFLLLLTFQLSPCLLEPPAGLYPPVSLPSVLPFNHRRCYALPSKRPS